MRLMFAYDDSTNAKKALAKTLNMFAGIPVKVTLIAVVEDELGASGVNEQSYEEYRYEFSETVRERVQELNEHGIQADCVIAEGDPRKMILKAVEERKPDLLVVARHSEKTDSNILGNALDAIVKEFNFMTFGSVSSFLARRVNCPILIQSCTEE